MSATFMTERIEVESLPLLKARAIYWLTVLTAVASLAALALIVFRNADAAAPKSLFRHDLTADLIGLASCVAATTLFYRLLRPANKKLSLATACAGFLACVPHAFAGAVNLASIVILRGAHALSIDRWEPVQSLALRFLTLHARAYNVGLTVFGLYCLVAACAILRSAVLPRITVLLLTAGGLAYVINGVAGYLAAPFTNSLFVFSGLGEGLLMLWLFVILNIRGAMFSRRPKAEGAAA